jgi:hypothetical protein
MPKTLDPRLANKDLLILAAMRLKHRQQHGAPQTLTIPETTLAQFVQHRPWQVDRHPFDWERHRYLLPLYEAFQLTPGANDGLQMVILKGAQTGASVFGMLGLIFLALKLPGSWSAYYLPDQAMTQIFSSNRFKPMVESNPLVAPLLGGERGESDNSNRLRTLGRSSVSFGYMGGKTSTESLPLLAVFFDEVRRMEGLHLNLAEERISHSPYPINIKLSTAGYPEQDIHAHFLRTNQQYYHSRCRCPDGVVLAAHWPDCIGIEGEEIFYRCPTCGTVITNPQEGRYLAHAPDKPIPGFHIPQTLSLAPLHAPAKLWAKYLDPQQDRGEFYRSALGLPYIDPDAQLVTADDLAACEDTELRWAPQGTNCVCGIDQMGGWNDVVVLQQVRSGKYRLVHLERIAGEDPFGDGRLDVLMRRYDVSCCVCDLNPNYNESLRFAKRWAPRVFLVTYSSSEQAPMIAWRDRERLRSQHANTAEGQFPYMVTIQRYKALDFALGLFRARLVAMPHRRGLVATVHDDHGVVRPVFLAEELFWPHLQRLVRQKHVLDAEQGTYKMEMVKVGADPHYAFAWLYAVVAAARSTGGGLPADLSLAPSLDLTQAPLIERATRTTVQRQWGLEGTRGAYDDDDAWR